MTRSDKQYRAILSFNTAALPDNAVITGSLLKIRKQGVVGTDPFTILGGLKVDIRKPYFGTGVGLVVGDFQAAAGRSNAATFRTTPVNNWYIAVIGATGYPYINLTGTTQFRLRFLTDDNDDGAADYMKFFSGNHATAAAQTDAGHHIYPAVISQTLKLCQTLRVFTGGRADFHPWRSRTPSRMTFRNAVGNPGAPERSGALLVVVAGRSLPKMKQEPSTHPYFHKRRTLLRLLFGLGVQCNNIYPIYPS